MLQAATEPAETGFDLDGFLYDLADPRTEAGLRFRNYIRALFVHKAPTLNLHRDDDAVEDIVSGAVIIALGKRDANESFTADQWRRWVNGVAKNLVLQARDAHLKRLTKLSTTTLDENLDGGEDVVVASDPFQDALEAAITAVPGMGEDGWHRVQEHLESKKKGSKKARRIAAGLHEDWLAGRPLLVRGLVAPHIRVEDWVAARLARGESISTVAAVADGVFPYARAARDGLAKLFGDYQCPERRQICVSQIVAAGLADHEHPLDRVAHAQHIADDLRFSHRNLRQRHCRPGAEKECVTPPFGNQLDLITGQAGAGNGESPHTGGLPPTGFAKSGTHLRSETADVTTSHELDQHVFEQQEEVSSA